MNQLLPVFIKIKTLRILLVGGGMVGAEKLSALLKNCSETDIRVVADRISDSVAILAMNHNNVRLIRRKFQIGDLEETDLVFLATDDINLHKNINEVTRKRHILTNVADTPELCGFYLGSVVQKGNLKIGISTNGKSPTMAKRMREFFEYIIPDNFNLILESLHQLRERIKGDFRRKVEILNQSTKSFIENEQQENTVYGQKQEYEQ